MIYDPNTWPVAETAAEEDGNRRRWATCPSCGRSIPHGARCCRCPHCSHPQTGHHFIDCPTRWDR